MSKILLIEHHDGLRPIFTEILKNEGHSVRISKTLRSAKNHLRRGPVDIVLSETRFGTPDEGLEVLELTNRLSPRPLVIFMSAFGGVSQALFALKSGAYDYLMKPFDVEELLTVLKNAVSESTKKDVFICHASPDKRQFIRPFVNSLAVRNVSYWVDEAEIKWGDSITDKISEGIVAARYVVVFLTANFLRCRWPALELKAALNREAESGDTIVLPVMGGDRRQILQRYPLLHDRAYAEWTDGPDSLADRVRELLVRRSQARHVGR